jgi:cytokinesis protein
MDSLWGRKKSRGRQSSISDLNEVSVPYDRLAPSPRSPVPVGTVSQGLRNPSFISAPITNPTLTSNGTELNKFAQQKTRIERERAYEQYHTNRPRSPSVISTADSSTLYSDAGPSSSSKTHTPQSSRLRRSEAASSSSSHGRTTSMSDFGPYPYQPKCPLPTNTSSAGSANRMSTSTTRSETHRNSKYAPSVVSSDAGSHLSHFYHPHRHHAHDGFDFPRPDTDEEIEVLFESVMRNRGSGTASLPNLSIDQKWHMVYNDWQIRYKDEKANEQARKQQPEAAAILPQSPEWYIQKFLHKTITAAQTSNLLVSLRNKEIA